MSAARAGGRGSGSAGTPRRQMKTCPRTPAAHDPITNRARIRDGFVGIVSRNETKNPIGFVSFVNRFWVRGSIRHLLGDPLAPEATSADHADHADLGVRT